MSQVTTERISDLVMANRAIRAPYYDSDQGLQWGGDIIPALMGLFRIEKDTRDDHGDGWVGFAALPEGYEPEYARDWQAEALRIDLYLTPGPDAPDSILVVTAMTGREADETRQSIEDEDVGAIELPDAVPTQDEWNARAREYQSVRSADDSDGSAAVKAFIAALPGWKGEVASRIDEIIERELPHVRRAIKWHQPFYGVEEQGLIASFTPLSKKLKLTFMSGTSLDPVPPGGRKDDARWLDLHEKDALDEELLSSWVRQAAAIPGWFP